MILRSLLLGQLVLAVGYAEVALQTSLWQTGWGRLVLREKGSYAYQKAFHTGVVNAFLVGSPESFTISTLTGAQNLGVVEIGKSF